MDVSLKSQLSCGETAAATSSTSPSDFSPPIGKAVGGIHIGGVERRLRGQIPAIGQANPVAGELLAKRQANEVTRHGAHINVEAYGLKLLTKLGNGDFPRIAGKQTQKFQVSGQGVGGGHDAPCLVLPTLAPLANR